MLKGLTVDCGEYTLSSEAQRPVYVQPLGVSPNFVHRSTHRILPYLISKNGNVVFFDLGCITGRDPTPYRQIRINLEPSGASRVADWCAACPALKFPVV